MKRINRALLVFTVMATLLALGTEAAFAKRMGGGKSFGSRPSYSESYRAPSSGSVSPGYQQPAFRSQAAQQNQAARESMARRGGLMGMLGGLALGGLLGAMLFGGAFEGLNLMDMLIFAGIAYLLYRLFAARRSQAPGWSSPTPAGAGAAPSYDRTADAAYQRTAEQPDGRGAGFDTDILSRKGAGNFRAVPTDGSPAAIPADFDVAEFLSRAKMAYGYLQRAWDAGDLADLRGLTTDKVFAELQEQLRDRQGPSVTELLEVDARLLDVSDTSSERHVSVLFDVMMREEPGAPAQRVRELWHFVRAHHSSAPTWFLDGLQQVDESV